MKNTARRPKITLSADGKGIVSQAGGLLLFAPAFVHFTDDVLFGEVWPRTELPAKERSLVTVSVLAALGASEQLAYHLGLARQNGNTETELKEAITPHSLLRRLAPGMSAMTVAKQVFGE